MPQWMHDRARHIQAKNPEMPESEAFAIATQQSHALGKSPSGFGTEEGHRKAKLKYTTPGDDKKTADPGGLGKEAGIGGRVKSFLGDAAAEGVRKRYEGPAKKILTGAGLFAGGTALAGHNFHKRISRLEQAQGQPKTASFIPASLGGLAMGFGPGRDLAEDTAAGLAPKGRVTRSSRIARHLAIAGAPLGGLAAMALSKKHNLAGKATRLLAKKAPKGLFTDPHVEQALLHHAVPFLAGAGGSMAGGVATGAATGLVQKARGPLFSEKEKNAKVTFLAPLADSFCDELEKIAIAVPQSMAMATQSPLGAVKTTVPKDTLKKSTTYSKVNSSPTVSPIAQHQPVLDAPPVRT